MPVHFGNIRFSKVSCSDYCCVSQVTALRRQVRPISGKVTRKVNLESNQDFSHRPPAGRTYSGSGAPNGTRYITQASCTKYMHCKYVHMTLLCLWLTIVCFRFYYRRPAGIYSTRMARGKWQSLERRISDIIMQRVTISNMETDMNRLLKVQINLLSWETPTLQCQICLNANTVDTNIYTAHIYLNMKLCWNVIAFTFLK